MSSGSLVNNSELEYWNGDLEDVVSCPACGGPEFAIAHEDLHDCVEGLPGTWTIKRCIACRCAYLSPRPSMSSLHKAYRTYYTHISPSDASDRGSSLVWRFINGYLSSRFHLNRYPSLSFGRYLIPFFFPIRQQLDFFMRHLPVRPGRLLDVGCGNGQFLRRAEQAGWRVLGLEPDPIAVCAARQSGVQVQQGLLDNFSSKELFDVITASHVIEHVHNPPGFVEKIFNHLQPGGMAWFTTPNIQSLGYWWFGPNWRGLEPPRHITVFSAKGLQLLLRRAGFVDIQFRRRGRGAKYILRTSEKIADKNGRKGLFSLPLILVDILASLHAVAGEELVVTAYRPKI